MELGKWLAVKVREIGREIVSSSSDLDFLLSVNTSSLCSEEMNFNRLICLNNKKYFSNTLQIYKYYLRQSETLIRDIYINKRNYV